MSGTGRGTRGGNGRLIAPRNPTQRSRKAIFKIGSPDRRRRRRRPIIRQFRSYEKPKAKMRNEYGPESFRNFLIGPRFLRNEFSAGRSCDQKWSAHVPLVSPFQLLAAIRNVLIADRSHRRATQTADA